MTTSPLHRIDMLTGRITPLGIERELAISRALAGGASWAEIGRALGCTPQAAHKRYRWVRHSERTGAVWHEPPLSR